MYTPLPEGVEIQYSYGFGAVGQGIGVAIGTGAGNPGRPHIAVEGDGSLMFNLQELETIVRHKMQMVLVVWNDAGYGAEVHKLVAKGFDEKLAQWESPNFVALAKAFGGDGVLLKDPSELGGAIAEGLRKGGLYLIDARVSPTTPTDPYAKVHFGHRKPRAAAAPGRVAPMHFEGEFSVPGKADDVIRRFADVPRMARCMPGAVLSRRPRMAPGRVRWWWRSARRRSTSRAASPASSTSRRRPARCMAAAPRTCGPRGSA